MLIVQGRDEEHQQNRVHDQAMQVTQGDTLGGRQKPKPYVIKRQQEAQTEPHDPPTQSNVGRLSKQSVDNPQSRHVVDQIAKNLVENGRGGERWFRRRHGLTTRQELDP